jgi:hypothetical protein
VHCNSRSIVGRFEFVLRTRVVLFCFNVQYFLFSTLLFFVFNIFLVFYLQYPCSLFYSVSSVQFFRSVYFHLRCSVFFHLLCSVLFIFSVQYSMFSTFPSLVFNIFCCFKSLVFVFSALLLSTYLCSVILCYVQ